MTRVMNVVWALIWLVVLLTFWTAAAHSHDTLHEVAPNGVAEVDQVELPFPPILECFKISKAEKVTSYVANWKGLRMFVMEIDTNEDGKKDGMLLFPIFRVTTEGMEISTRVSHVVLDLNYDGKPDGAWFDRTGRGTCETLIEIPLNTIIQDSEKHAHG